nr:MULTISPECIES: hypothetical protein [Streptomyces]
MPTCGVLALAIVSAALLVFSGGDTNTLVPLFAIGVFVGFTIVPVDLPVRLQGEHVRRVVVAGQQLEQHRQAAEGGVRR